MKTRRFVLDGELVVPINGELSFDDLLQRIHPAASRVATLSREHRTADCVVGGFRYAAGTKVAGSLLLGLYDEDGPLHHVGFTSSFKAAEKAALTKTLEAVKGGKGFTGRAPGGPSRWSTERSAEWVPLEPALVVEVDFDHFSQGRFRHGTKFMRWRPDKKPSQCTFDQLRPVRRGRRGRAGVISGLS